jgi:hypothetical protein
MKAAYPLSWPEGWKRTPSSQREAGRFNKKERESRQVPPGQPASYSVRTRDLSVADAVDRILGELGRMGIERQDVIVSTNVRTRIDGMPRSGERAPDDPGAAVYWKLPQQPTRCMAVDRYTKVADNLAAIAATLEAMRAIERHGGAEILNRTFQGFLALPEKASQPWREVLGLRHDPVTIEGVEAKFREAVRICHPDIPGTGDRDKYEAIVRAREDARNELRATL